MPKSTKKKVPSPKEAERRAEQSEQAQQTPGVQIESVVEQLQEELNVARGQVTYLGSRLRDVTKEKDALAKDLDDARAMLETVLGDKEEGDGEGKESGAEGNKRKKRASSEGGGPSESSKASRRAGGAKRDGSSASRKRV